MSRAALETGQHATPFRVGVLLILSLFFLFVYQQRTSSLAVPACHVVSYPSLSRIFLRYIHLINMGRLQNNRNTL